MSRSLSALQKYILTTAYENRQREKRTDDDDGADVFAAEIKHGFYKFHSHTRGPVRKAMGSHSFILKGESADISENDYRSASVAISKAFASLERRGLVVRYQGAVTRWAGLRLTPDGIEHSESLLELLANKDNPE